MFFVLFVLFVFVMGLVIGSRFATSVKNTRDRQQILQSTQLEIEDIRESARRREARDQEKLALMKGVHVQEQLEQNRILVHIRHLAGRREKEVTAHKATIDGHIQSLRCRNDQIKDLESRLETANMKHAEEISSIHDTYARYSDRTDAEHQQTVHGFKKQLDDATNKITELVSAKLHLKAETATKVLALQMKLSFETEVSLRLIENHRQ